MTATIGAGSLALFAWPKIIIQPFGRFNPIGREEIEGATAVVESGVLSKFPGC